MSDTIPLSVPEIDGNEWQYIKECLDTNWVSSAGSFVDRFEDEVADYVGAEHAVACVNGTSALHVSMRVAGVQPDDLVLAPTVTFIAPINAIRYLGADPVFFDCDQHLNIDTDDVMEFLNRHTYEKDGETFHEESNRRISAIVPVHVFGNAVKIEPLVGECQERNITIVEDASESLGTTYTEGKFEGHHTGTIGKLGCFSFNGNKIITTGGGGMIVTDDEDLATKAEYLTTQAKDDPKKYVHNQVGYNYRLTNIQAAMGVAQLEQLPEFLKRKQRIKKLYHKKIDSLDYVRLIDEPGYDDTNNWLISLNFISEGDISNSEVFSWELVEKLENRNIQCRPLWQLNHKQEPYKDCPDYRIHLAEKKHNEILVVPSSVSLKEQDIDKVIKALDNCYS